MEKNRITIKQHGETYTIIVSPMQKIVQIHRLYDGINFEANFEAMKNLSANAYILYQYLLMHENGRVWALSSKDVYDKTPLTHNTYYKAVQELIDKNYLQEGIIAVEDIILTSNAYHLFEKP